MINLIDKINFYLNDHGVDGSHVSDVILVNKVHHPDLMKNKAVLYTEDMRIDFHSEDTGLVSASVSLSQEDVNELITLLEQRVSAVETLATNADVLSKQADALSKSNKTEIDAVSLVADAAKDASAANLASVNSLSTSVGENASAISTNSKNINTNTTAISSKADSSTVDALASTVATKANISDVEALSNTVSGISDKTDTNASDLSSLSTSVDSLSVEIISTKSIAEKASSDVTELKPQVSQNTANIATKADQSDLTTISNNVGQNTSGISQNAKSISELETKTSANESQLTTKVSVDSDASLNNLEVKNNITMGSGAGYVTGIADAASALDAMNKRSVESITNALSGRIDTLAAGTGDESDYISVHGLDGLITYDDVILKTRLEQLDGDTQCHIAFNEIRNSRPLKNRSEVRWVMREYVHDGHVIWNFCPTKDIESKDGILVIQHTQDEGCVVTITTESTILVKQMRYNFGSGNNGRRHDWQTWQPRVKGWEGFGKGQILTDSDISWETSSNVRTNMQRLRDKLPNGCAFIGWHNHTANDNKYRIVAKGNTSTIEGTSGVYYLFRHGGTSSIGGFYVNSASGTEGWTRVYLGATNTWASFGKQDNRSSKVTFEGVSEVVVPYYETPPDLSLFFVATSSDDLLQTHVVSKGKTYESVGRYSVYWDGNWTDTNSMHTAYYNEADNVYIAYDQLTYTWIMFTPAKSHTAVGTQAVNEVITKLNSRSQFPKTDDTYVVLGDLDTLSYNQIAQPQVIHDTVNKTSKIVFGDSRWGYIAGGGVPSTEGDYPENGIDPIPTEEE